MIFLAVSIIYGVLSALAAVVQMGKKGKEKFTLMMLAGGILLLLSSTCLYFVHRGFIVIIIALLIIHLAAICNGMKMFGKINIGHHFVRLMVSIMIIMLGVGI